MKKGQYVFAVVLALSGLVFLRGQNSRPLRDRLVGTWRLISSTQWLTDGRPRHEPQTGLNGAGYLVYTQGGQVCFVVGNPDRSRWASLQAPTDEDLRKAFEGL